MKARDYWKKQAQEIMGKNEEPRKTQTVETNQPQTAQTGETTAETQKINIVFYPCWC